MGPRPTEPRACPREFATSECDPSAFGSGKEGTFLNSLLFTVFYLLPPARSIVSPCPSQLAPSALVPQEPRKRFLLLPQTGPMKHTPSIPFPVRPNIFPVWISSRWCRPLLFSPKAKMVMALLPALVGCAESMKHAETGGPPAGLQKHPLQARPAGNRGLGEGGGLRPWGKRVSSRRGACDWFPGCLPHLRRPVHFTPI